MAIGAMDVHLNGSQPSMSCSHSMRLIGPNSRDHSTTRDWNCHWWHFIRLQVAVVILVIAWCWVARSCFPNLSKDMWFKCHFRDTAHSSAWAKIYSRSCAPMLMRNSAVPIEMAWGFQGYTQFSNASTLYLQSHYHDIPMISPSYSYYVHMCVYIYIYIATFGGWTP